MRQSQLIHYLLVAAIALSGFWAGSSADRRTEDPTSGRPGMMRALTAVIRIDGEDVLRARSADDGSADVDEVWDRLKRLRFVPTEAFESLGVADDAEEISWSNSGSISERELNRKLQVEAGYGGTSSPLRLRVRRLPATERDPAAWSIVAEDVDRMFAHRLVYRWQAADLKNPSRQWR